MKNKKLSNDIYKSFAEFEKAFLPETYKERTSAEPTDKHSRGILLAKEFVDEVCIRTKCKT